MGPLVHSSEGPGCGFSIINANHRALITNPVAKSLQQSGAPDPGLGWLESYPGFSTPVARLESIGAPSVEVVPTSVLDDGAGDRFLRTTHTIPVIPATTITRHEIPTKHKTPKTILSTSVVSGTEEKKLFRYISHFYGKTSAFWNSCIILIFILPCH